MNLAEGKSKKKVTLVMEGSLTIGQVGAIRDELRNAL
jgi:hypothetical protein